MIKRVGIAWALQQCLLKKQSPYSIRNDFDPDRLQEFIQDVDAFLDKDIQVRCEGSIFTIYCNDEKLFNKMIKKLDHWISEVYVPSNDAEQAFIEANGNKKIICNHLPHKRYRYRVHIKERINVETREKLFNWMAKYDGKFRVPYRVAMWMTGRKQWVSGPSIYVEDGPALSMLLLFLGDRVSKVEEFVPRDMINIQSKEEKCPV